MNRRTFLAGCAGILSATPAAVAGEPTKRDIDGLIKQRGNGVWERESAIRLLAKLGHKALPALTQPQGHASLPTTNERSVYTIGVSLTTLRRERPVN